MTDKTHLEEFKQTIKEALSQKLVEIFVECHRDHSLRDADITTRLKEEMEAALIEDGDAAS